MEKEIKDLINEMSEEQRVQFLKKREEALKVASTEPKNFEIGSGNSLMEVAEIDESEAEARKDINNQV